MDNVYCPVCGEPLVTFTQKVKGQGHQFGSCEYEACPMFHMTLHVDRWIAASHNPAILAPYGAVAQYDAVSGKPLSGK